LKLELEGKNMMSKDVINGTPVPNSPIGASSISNESLKNLIDGLQQQFADLQKLVIAHENELKQNKQITNSYVDSILSKIEILKNIIKKNIGDEDEFISQHLLMVESIEEQIKTSGKISDAQFKTLNDIYKKQKRV
jgi:hypothetical protein